jgi:hypothetical protein
MNVFIDAFIAVFISCIALLGSAIIVGICYLLIIYIYVVIKTYMKKMK